MKKLNYIIIVIIGLLALCSCEDAIDSAYVPSTQQNSTNGDSGGIIYTYVSARTNAIP